MSLCPQIVSTRWWWSLSYAIKPPLSAELGEPEKRIDWLLDLLDLFSQWFCWQCRHTSSTAPSVWRRQIYSIHGTLWLKRTQKLLLVNSLIDRRVRLCKATDRTNERRWQMKRFLKQRETSSLITQRLQGFRLSCGLFESDNEKQWRDKRLTDIAC